MSTLVAPRYEAVAGWERMPQGYAHPDVAAVAVDSKDRVFLFCRSEHPVMIYERDGRFVGSWGEGAFTMRTHGITIAPDDSVWCTDDARHSVRKFTPDGEMLMALGDNAGRPSESGYDGSSITTVARGAPPFNRPTNLAVAPNGDLFVSDGYGNARVHRFSASGKLLASWGEPGTGPGQFMLPHGVAVDSHGDLYVAEVVWTIAGKAGLVPPDCHTVQKLQRID
jgi:DNA-binding beta-propeller fold protein YncE